MVLSRITVVYGKPLIAKNRNGPLTYFLQWSQRNQTFNKKFYIKMTMQPERRLGMKPKV
jgi:hypothetical protein